MFHNIQSIIQDELEHLDVAQLLQRDAKEVLAQLSQTRAISGALDGVLRRGPMSLRDALDFLAQPEIASGIPLRHQEAFIDDLLMWLEEAVEEAPSLERPPASREQILASPALASLLDQQAQDVLSWEVFARAGIHHRSSMTVRQLLADDGKLAKQNGVKATRFSELQRSVLLTLDNALAKTEAQAAKEQAWLEGLSRWPATLSEPERQSFEALQRILLDERARLRSDFVLDAQGFPTVRVQRTPYAPVLSFENTSPRVELDLRAGIDAATLRIAGTASKRYIIAFIDAVLRSMHSQDELGQWLRKLLEGPTWGPLLAALDEASAASADDARARSFLSWRVTGRSGTRENPTMPSIECYLHKHGKRGPSVGARVEPHRWGGKDVELLEQDKRALVLYGRSQYSSTDRLELLKALRGHPRVFFSDELARPIEIRLATFGLALLSDGAKMQLRPTLDGEAVTVEPNADCIFHADRARAALLIATLDSRQCKLAQTLSAYDGAALPRDAQEPLLARLQRLEGALPVALPEELRGDAVAPESTPIVRLHAHRGVFDVAICARPLAGGIALTPGEGPKEMSALVNGARVHTVRDIEAERAQAAELQEALGLVDDADRAFHATLTDEQRMLDVLAALRERPEVTVEWTGAEQPMHLVRQQATANKLHVRVREGKEWFRLDGELEVDGARIALALALDAARRGHRYVKLDGERWVALEASLRERLQALDAFSHETRGHREVGVPGVIALDALEQLGAECETPQRWRTLRDKMRAADASPPEVPAALQAELRPYQEEGFRWLHQLSSWGVGACLADDMGLGKTVQALAVITARASLGPTLVIAPTSVCFNWRNECARFAPSLAVTSYERGELSPEQTGPGALLIASYGAMVRHIDTLSAQRFATIVFDEAHALKNTDTQRTRAARQLQGDWLFGLTGTPVENRLGELWSLFHVLSPGLFGSSEHFRERFVLPIERDKDLQRRRSLSRLCRPFILRRTKAVVAPDLPAKTEIDVPIVLSADEQAMYDDARLAAQARLQAGGEDQRFALLAALTRLRLLACHPRLYDASTSVPSSKLETFSRLVDDLLCNRHRALVFSQFTKHLALIREILEQKGIAYQYLDGSTPKAQREQAVAAFQRGEGALFLVSVQAGGTGLNLTAADYVIHLDPWWNPAVEDQATGRAHRIGQDKPVTVYRLFAQRTIEERILALHREKRDLAATVLDESSEATQAQLSIDELMSLAFG